MWTCTLNKKDIRGLADLPRLHDLARSAPRTGDPDKDYFADVDTAIARSTLARDSYVNTECRLSHLDDAAWRTLKEKCYPYVSRPTERRRWEQLFSVLNEAVGYILLKILGYTSIRFVEEDTEKQPDVIALHPTKPSAAVEVKTIWRSEESIDAIGQWRGLPDRLPGEFRTKLEQTLAVAQKQLRNCGPNCRRIVLVSIELDYKSQIVERQFINQLVEWCQELRPPGHDVVIEHKNVWMSILPETAA